MQGSISDDKEADNPFMGRESLLHGYCSRAIDAGHENCIWICMKIGKQYRLIDIPIVTNGQPIGVADIRERHSWWKRHSLYSVVGVKEVMARVLDVDDTKGMIIGAVAIMNHTANADSLDKDIERAEKDVIDWDECGMDIMGEHYCVEEFCPNATRDNVIGELYCTRRRYDSLFLRRQNCDWLTEMLEYYWHRGIDKNGIDFLKKSGFVDEYESLKHNAFIDAANPYGQTVYAFLVVEGWNIRLFLQLVSFGVFLTICIVSVVTAVSHSLDVGMTAGSYAASLLAVLLAVFAFLSAVL